MVRYGTKVSQVFVLPLVIASIFFVVNRGEDMQEHKAGPLLNLGMIFEFIFAFVISYTAILVLIELACGLSCYRVVTALLEQEKPHSI